MSQEENRLDEMRRLRQKNWSIEEKIWFQTRAEKLRNNSIIGMCVGGASSLALCIAKSNVLSRTRCGFLVTAGITIGGMSGYLMADTASIASLQEIPMNRSALRRELNEYASELDASKASAPPVQVINKKE